MKTLSKITLAAIAALLLMAPTAFASGGSCSANSGGNYCGGKAASGCYCDDECVNYGDCCGDVEDVCNGGNEPEPQPEPVQPAPEAYELDCYTETFGPIAVEPGAIGNFTVRCDDDYRATGGGAREVAGLLDPMILDAYPSDNDTRDWVIRYNARLTRSEGAVEGRARCCR